MKRVRTQVMVLFRVDARDQEQAHQIVLHEIIGAQNQMFKRWYNQYDDSNGIVAFKIVEERGGIYGTSELNDE